MRYCQEARSPRLFMYSNATCRGWFAEVFDLKKQLSNSFQDDSFRRVNHIPRHGIFVPSCVRSTRWDAPPFETEKSGQVNFTSRRRDGRSLRLLPNEVGSSQ